MNEQASLYSCISKIAWGFVFILFHIKINTIDLLPDFVGYILIAVGIGGMGAFLEHIKILRPVSIVLSIWTASVWFAETITLNALPMMGYISIAMGIATLIFNIILLTDLSAIATKYQPEDKNIDRRLIASRNIYAVCYSLQLGASAASVLTAKINAELIVGIYAALSFALLFAMLAIMLVILVSLFSLKKIIQESDLNQTYGVFDIPPFENKAAPPFTYTEPPVSEQQPDDRNKTE